MENIIVVTLATPSDAEGINRGAHDAWLVTYPNKEAGITKEDVEDKVKDRLSPEEIEKKRLKLTEGNTNNKTFVAREGEQVVGFCTIYKDPEYNQLKAIYISPSLQGRGIGQKLWQQVLAEIRDNKNKIIVQVATYNTQAIEFYKKLGFKETGKNFSDERFRMKSGSIIPETELVIERQ